MAMRQTSTDYQKPYRPLPIKTFNSLGGQLKRVRLETSLKMESLLDAARRETKLSDFGQPAFDEPLSALLTAMEEEAELHPFGRLIARKRLIGILANRLRLTEFTKEHPGVLAQELPPVIIICGLQRTGTTLLHRLLAADRRMRALLSFEAIKPVPVSRDSEIDHKERMQFAKRAERALLYMAPDFFAIHPVEALAPEEDVLLLDHGFMSTVPEAMMRVPSYAAWVEQNDNTPAYELHIALLKVLLWQKPAPCWVLKSPHHLEFLDIVFELFPRLTIVQTHRDPAVTLPSFCSMLAHSRGVFSDRVDPREVGEHWLRKTARIASRGLEVRKRVGDDHFIDIYYDELMRDPMSQVERIYAKAKMELGPGARKQIEASRKVNVQHRYGVHRYSLEDFGLSRDAVHEAYRGYLSHFDIPIKKTV
jgi:hypothetical protein